MLISIKEGRERLGVNKDTFRALVKQGHFTLFTNPRDRRSKLVDTDELDAYLKPKVIRERQPHRRVDQEKGPTREM